MVTVSGVRHGSPAHKAGIKAGDILLAISGNEINDALDYYFYAADDDITVELLRGDTHIKKHILGCGDLGMEFETFLMDKKRSCRNNCIFCFIDQNPEGMRETIYFKDDDERLSFLQGSYVTLTNLKQKDIDRIIRMRISPINISVHTMDKELRVKMLRNRFAGEVLSYIDDIDRAGLDINAQIVLCKGVNDGKALEYTLTELLKREHVVSIAVVPCGLTKHREGLYKLDAFDKDDCGEVIDIVERFADECFKTRGEHICYCSDEFYLTACREMPSDDYYDGYPQLDNGVGSLRNHKEEFLYALANTDECVYNRSIVIITGMAAYDHICELVDAAKAKFDKLDVRAVAIRNDFYGESVTVSGLVTGGDIINQVAGTSADLFLIPRNMLRADGDLFLDGVSLDTLVSKLGAPVMTVESGGEDLCRMITEDY